MPNLQQWVNRWVRVNSNKARFPDDDELEAVRHVQIRHIPSPGAAKPGTGDGASTAGLGSSRRSRTVSTHPDRTNDVSSSIRSVGSSIETPDIADESQTAASTSDRDSSRARHQRSSTSPSTGRSSGSRGSGRRSPRGNRHRNRPPSYRSSSAGSDYGHYRSRRRRHSDLASSTVTLSTTSKNSVAPVGAAAAHVTVVSSSSGTGGGGGSSHTISNRPGVGVRGRKGKDQGNKLTRTNSHSDLLKEKFDEMAQDKLLQQQHLRMEDFLVQYHQMLTKDEKKQRQKHQQQEQQPSGLAAVISVDASKNVTRAQSRRKQHPYPDEYQEEWVRQRPPPPPTSLHSKEEAVVKDTPPNSLKLQQDTTHREIKDHFGQNKQSNRSTHDSSSSDNTRMPTRLQKGPSQHQSNQGFPVDRRKKQFPQHTSASQTQPLGQAPPTAGQHCQRCQSLEKTLLLMQSDIEYLRSMAVTSECDNVSVASSTCQSMATKEGEALRLSDNQAQASVGGDASSVASSQQASSSATSAFMCTCRGCESAELNGLAAPSSSSPGKHNYDVQRGSSCPCPCPVHGADGISPSSLPADGSASDSSKQVTSPQHHKLEQNGNSGTLGDASHRILEVMTRHKGQIERITHEMTRWQSDVHHKLSDYTTMCHDLDEESSIRRQDTDALQRQLVDMSTERNAFAGQVDGLSSRLASHSGREGRSQGSKGGSARNLEIERLRNALQERDKILLKRAEEAVCKRDQIIAELSQRLRSTVDTLETERQQHRQRRQVIFPPGSRSLSIDRASMGSLVSIGGSANEQLFQAKEDAREDAREAIMTLEEFKIRAKKREDDLRARCDAMARQLQLTERRLLEAESHP